MSSSISTSYAQHNVATMHSVMQYPSLSVHKVDAIIKESIDTLAQLPIPEGYTLVPIPTYPPISPAAQAPPMPINMPSTSTFSSNTIATNTRDQYQQPQYENNNQYTKPPLSTKREENKISNKCNNHNEQNSYNYEPSPGMRVYKNITIPRAFMLKLQSKLSMNLEKLQCHLDHKNKDCKCYPLYTWMDIDIAMQFSNSYANKNIKILNLGQEFFCVIEAVKDDEKTTDIARGKFKKKREWRMHEIIYTKQMIMQRYKLRQDKLPVPVRKSPRFRSQLLQKNAIKSSLKNPEKVNEVINKTKWGKIKIFSKLKTKRRKILFIPQCELRQDLRNSKICKNEQFELFPIILFRNKNYSIHHVIIVKIDDSNVGISMIYDNSSQSVHITGIHVDERRIRIQHQWISLDHLKECNHECFNNFESHIDHVRIGNVDEDKNKMKALQVRYDKLQEEYHKLANSKQ